MVWKTSCCGGKNICHNGTRLILVERGKKRIVHVGFFCTFQLVTGAWGEQGLWSLSDQRNVFRLQVRVFLPIPFREGEWAYWKVSYILGLCFTTVFARLFCLLLTRIRWASVTHLVTLMPPSLQALGPALQADSPPGWFFELCPIENIVISTARYTLVVGRWECYIEEQFLTSFPPSSARVKNYKN